MHEFSISSEIVQNVLDAAEKKNARKVLSIQLDIGELCLINVEQVVHWVQVLFKGTMAEGAEVKVKTIKAIVQCPSCGFKGRNILDSREIDRHVAAFQCPRCRSPEVKVNKGRECLLRKIQALK